MTVTTNTSRISYTGDGASTVFAVPFIFLNNADIVVYVNGIQVTTGFATTGAGSGTGNVTFTTAPASGAVVLLVRDPDFLQNTDLPSNGPFPSGSVEEMSDKAMIAIQRLSDLQTRSLTLSDGEAELELTLPLPADRGDRVLGFADSTGALEMSPFTMTQVASAVAAAYLGGAATTLDAVAFVQAGTGAISSSSQAKMRESVSINDYGAVGDGVTDDTAALLAAFTAMPDGGRLVLPSGFSYLISSVDFTGKAVTIEGFGATIVCTSALGAIKKTDHGKKLTVLGITFAGAGRAISYQAAVTATEFDDMSLHLCTFLNAEWGVNMVGVRESRIVDCSFSGSTQKGLYRRQCVNTNLIGCYWKNTVYGVFDDGDNTGASAGLQLVSCTMIGCADGVYSNEADYLSIIGCMIDYCDRPISILGTAPAVVSDNFISSRTDAPAIKVDVGTVNATLPKEVRIHHNIVLQHTADVTSVGAWIHHCSSGSFTDNSLTFWWLTGLDIGSNTNFDITRNKFSKDPAATTASPLCIKETGAGDSSNLVAFNEFSLPSGAAAISLGANTSIAGNVGYLTQLGGEAISGVGASSVVVAHGLDYTPNKYDVSLTPTNSDAVNAKPYISAVDATNLTIGFATATAAAAGVAWAIKRRSIK